MPVKIIRRSAAVQGATPAPSAASTGHRNVIIRRAPASKPATPPPIGGVNIPFAKNPRGWVVGEGTILNKHDLFDEAGHVKFLLNRVREKVWHLIREYDDEAKHISLRSQVQFDFSCKVDATLYRNWVVVVYPEGTLQPDPDMLTFVSRRLPHLQISASEPAAA